MISENVDRYENVIIRNNKEIGINTFGLDYLVSLEKEIESWKRVVTMNFNRAEDYKDIIKEVREYINKNGILDLNGYDLLEILDKVDENK